MKTLPNPNHADARQRSWLAREHGRKSRMYLRRRRNEPEKIQHCLRRSYISWQAKRNGRTGKHTLCTHRVCGLWETSDPTELMERYNMISCKQTDSEIAVVRLTVSVTRKWAG